MLRSELMVSIKKIIKLVEESRIIDVLRITRSNRGEVGGNSSLVPQAYKTFQLHAVRFSPSEINLLEVMGLGSLLDDKFWSSLLGQRVGESSLVDRNVFGSLVFAKDHLPKIFLMLERDTISRYKDSMSEELEDRERRDVLKVIVLEDDRHLSSPKRIQETMKSIIMLYEGICLLHDLPSSDLGVLACDSDSDKVFDFIGLAQVFSTMKDIILSMWDRVVFFKEQKMSARLALVAESLPILDHIGSLEQDEKLSKEHAEVIRRKIVGGISVFMEAGLSVPDIDSRPMSTRELLSPSPKLLLEGPAEAEEDAPGGGGLGGKQFEGLSRDEIAELKEVAAQMRDRRGGKHDADAGLDTEEDEETE